MTEHILPERSNPRRFISGVSTCPAAILASLISLCAGAATPCPPSLDESDGNAVVSAGQACPVAPPAEESDTPDYNDPLAACNSLDARRTISVAKSEALQSAINGAACGDTIQLAPGTYSGDFSIDKSCSMTKPVIIKGSDGFESVMTGELNVKGARTIVTGLKFSGPEAGIRLSGTNNKVISNKFTDWRHVAILAEPGNQGEIAYNEFSKPHPWLASEAGSYPLRIGIRTTEKDPASFHFNAWVHHNYFHDLPAKPNPSNYNSGQSDAIEVCQSGRESTATMRTGWYVESNLVERHLQGHGIIDFKCGGNVARFNTILNSPGGRLDARAGSYNVFEGNWIENSGGTSIHGGYNKIVGNHVDGGRISVMAGEMEWDSAGGGHPRAFSTLLAGNDASELYVGKENEGRSDLPALDTTIEGHIGGRPILGREQQTTIRQTTSLRIPHAVKLSSAAVGPTALRGAPAKYLACRQP